MELELSRSDCWSHASSIITSPSASYRGAQLKECDQLTKRKTMKIRLSWYELRLIKFLIDESNMLQRFKVFVVLLEQSCWIQFPAGNYQGFSVSSWK